jgi:virginiamycin B lyase
MSRLSVLVSAVVVAAVALILASSDTGAMGHLRTSQVASAPSNDKVGGATRIGDLPATLRGSASGATRDAGDPECANEDHTVWYRFRPSANGRFLATLRETLGGDICVLAKVDGRLREVSQIVGEPDLGDPVPAAFDATAGSDYYILVGILIGSRGTFTLSLRAATAFKPTWPTDVAVGPDGALWFTSSHGQGSIGRVTTTGHIKRYTSPKLHGPIAITDGPDGALWFTTSHSIGRITTRGAITIYTDKRLIAPVAITKGSDGSLWFADHNEELGEGGSIGRISTTGAIRIYRDPRINAPAGITSGPDGAIWFTNTSGGSIGRIDKTGRLNFFTDRRIAGPQAITAGPDGALWFTMLGLFTMGPGRDVPEAIGRITVDGAVRLYRSPIIKEPSAIAASPDGALWFTNFSGRSIGRISVSGTFRRYTGSSISQPFNITAGADGTIWFTDGNGSIGRISKAGLVTSFPPPAKRDARRGRHVSRSESADRRRWRRMSPIESAEHVPPV